jgi:hypothetical protein
MLVALANRVFRSHPPHTALSARRRRTRVRCVTESLEERNLLSTAVDQPPLLAAIPTQSVEEGSTLSLQATATDPNPGHTVTFSLDPGAPTGAIINPTSGLLVWTPPNVHTFYSLTVRATDSGPEGLSAAQTFTVMVFDVPPSVNAGINTSIQQGTPFVRSGNFVDTINNSWTATVDYGDGSGVQPLSLAADKTFQLDHNYTTPGNYVVSVNIFDSQDGQGHGYFAVQVLPPGSSGPNTATPATSTPTPAGSSQGQLTFTDGVVTAQSAPSGNATTTAAAESRVLHSLLKFHAKHPVFHVPKHIIPSHKHH